MCFDQLSGAVITQKLVKKHVFVPQSWKFSETGLVNFFFFLQATQSTTAIDNFGVQKNDSDFLSEDSVKRRLGSGKTINDVILHV